MTTIQRYKDLKFKLFAGLTILMTGIMSYIHLQEFITVAIFQEIAGYPFGGEGTIPWYYQTAELYSKVCLTFGLGYLSAFIASICTTIKRNKKGLIIAFILLIVIEAVNLYVF